jgi:hypothetical protein
LNPAAAPQAAIDLNRCKKFHVMPFVPEDFEPQQTVDLQGMQLRVLAPADTEIDYRCVMAARARLRTVFGPTSTWPAADMSLAQNTADLVRHEAEFHAREAFAYSIWSPAGDYLGCLYIDPVKSRLEHDRRRERFDARCYFWASNEAFADDAAMCSRLQRWLAEAWPFAAAAWPGRAIGWEEWAAMA